MLYPYIEGERKKKQISFNDEIQIKITAFGHAILKTAYDNGDKDIWFTNELGKFVLPEVNEEGIVKFHYGKQ